MKIYIVLLILAIFSLQACKKDSKEDIVKKKVKILIFADPGIYATNDPVAIQISGTNIQTVDNVTSEYILEAEYPVGELQSITIKATKGNPYMRLMVKLDYIQYDPVGRIADLSGKGILTAAFYPEDIESPITAPREEAGQIVLNDIPYSVVQIGTQLWTSRDYSGYRNGTIRASGLDSVINYSRFYTPKEAESIPLTAGWRIPSLEDYQKMRATTGNLTNIMQSGMWYGSTTNTSKLSLYPIFENNSDDRKFSYYMIKNHDTYTSVGVGQRPGEMPVSIIFSGSVESVPMALRFVKDK